MSFSASAGSASCMKSLTLDCRPQLRLQKQPCQLEALPREVSNSGQNLRVLT